jgi:hypothetical protein
VVLVGRYHRVPDLRPRGMADLTVIRGLFGVQTFHVAAILDVSSRLPLVAAVLPVAPTYRGTSLTEAIQLREPASGSSPSATAWSLL